MTEKQGEKNLKEKISPEQLKSMLQQWVEALDQKRDLEVNIKGDTCRVPHEAFIKGVTRAEYEAEDDEYEFEIELKWKGSDLSTSASL